MHGTGPTPTQDQSAGIGYVIRLGSDDLSCLEHVTHVRGTDLSLVHAPDGMHTENKFSIVQTPTPIPEIARLQQYHGEGSGRRRLESRLPWLRDQPLETAARSIWCFFQAGLFLNPDLSVKPIRPPRRSSPRRSNDRHLGISRGVLRETRSRLHMADRTSPLTTRRHFYRSPQPGSRFKLPFPSSRGRLKLSGPHRAPSRSRRTPDAGRRRRCNRAGSSRSRCRAGESAGPAP